MTENSDKPERFRWYKFKDTEPKWAVTFGVDADGAVWFPVGCVGGLVAALWIGCPIVSVGADAYMPVQAVRHDQAHDPEFLDRVDKCEARVLQAWREDAADATDAV